MLVIDIFKTYVMNVSGEKMFASNEDFMEVYMNNAENIDYELMRLYGQRDFYNPFKDVVDNYVYWKKCWDGFLHRRKAMFQKAWDSLNKNYDFDNNYHRHSEVDTDYMGKEKTHMVNGDGVTDNVHSEVPYDKQDFKQISKDIVTTHQRTGDSDLTYEDRKDKVVEDTYGNTGIYSPSTLLKDEYTLRINTDFYISIIKQFIDEVTIYL